MPPSTHPDPGRVPLRRLNRREYANAVHDLIGLDVDPAAWLPEDPLKDGFDTDADLLRVTPNFLDQSVAAARALALEAVGDPKAAPIDTTYGNIANMIISLNPRPGMGTGDQEKYQDGMPFGTRGGMVAEHWFAADGEYSLTIGDMAMAREVPKLEFVSTVIVLLDGKEIHRVNVGGEKRLQGHRPEPGCGRVPRQQPPARYPLSCHRRPAQGGRDLPAAQLRRER